MDARREAASASSKDQETFQRGAPMSSPSRHRRRGASVGRAKNGRAPVPERRYYCARGYLTPRLRPSTYSQTRTNLSWSWIEPIKQEFARSEPPRWACSFAGFGFVACLKFAAPAFPSPAPADRLNPAQQMPRPIRTHLRSGARWTLSSAALASERHDTRAPGPGIGVGNRVRVRPVHQTRVAIPVRPDLFDKNELPPSRALAVYAIAPISRAVFFLGRGGDFHRAAGSTSTMAGGWRFSLQICPGNSPRPADHSGLDN